MTLASTEATPASATTARLLVTCPDQPGIISAVSTFFITMAPTLPISTSIPVI